MKLISHTSALKFIVHVNSALSAFFSDGSSGAQRKYWVFILPVPHIAQPFNKGLQTTHLVTYSFWNHFRTSFLPWTMHVYTVNRAVITVDSSVRGCRRRWNCICTFNPLLSVFDDVTACGPAATHTDVHCCSCFVREMSARYRNTFIPSTQSYAVLFCFLGCLLFFSLSLPLFCQPQVHWSTQNCWN